MDQSITQEDNLILQGYYTVVLLKELGKSDFLRSDYYTTMNFDSLPIKEGLSQVGIDNQGIALMTLYAMLVIPKELIEKEYENEYNNINAFLRTHCINTTTSYPKEVVKDVSTINFVHHIRNAVAHVRVSFEPGHIIAFTDRRADKNGNIKAEFATELPLSKFGDFLNALQRVHLKYIDNRRNS